MVTARTRSGKSSETAMMPAMEGGTGEARNAIGTTTTITTVIAGDGGSTTRIAIGITRITTVMIVTGDIAGIPISIDETCGRIGIIVNRYTHGSSAIKRVTSIFRSPVFLLLFLARHAFESAAPLLDSLNRRH
jgi:hypothetical protein